MKTKIVVFFKLELHLIALQTWKGSISPRSRSRINHPPGVTYEPIMAWKKWRNHLSTSQHLISFCYLGCDLFTNGRILWRAHSILCCFVLTRHHTHVRLAGSQACKWWDTKTSFPDILQVPVSWIGGFLRFDESLWLFRGKRVAVASLESLNVLEGRLHTAILRVHSKLRCTTLI